MSVVYSAAPYRKVSKRAGEGLQIDLLIQTKRSQCVVEIKRQRKIGHGVIKEVSDKIGKLRQSPGTSIRAALVYDGELEDTVRADGYFDAIVSFSKLIAQM